VARPKRSSKTLQKAEQREAGLQSISSDLDLGNGLTLETYSALIQTLRLEVAAYNAALSNIDDLTRQIRSTEQKLRDLSEQMLLGVAAKYGKNSREYGKAGGVPKSEYRRATQKKTAAPSGDLLQPSVRSTSINETAVESVNENGNGNGNGLVAKVN
jgi:hypothetical protein